MFAIPDIHGHAKGEHKSYLEERPLPLTARMLFLWFYHACRRGYPRFLMVADHMNYLTFEDPAAVNLVRRALKLAEAGDLYGAAETANVDVAHASVVGEGLRRGMRYSIGAEVDNDPRSRPDAQNIVDAMRPDGIVRSVHFIPITHPVHGENWLWPFDNPEFRDLYDVVGTDRTWELYVAALVEAIERLPGHIVGHFFVPAVFGHWPDDAKLEEYEDRVLAAAGERGMAIEFNTRFLYREHNEEETARYIAANKRLLRKAKERGVAIAVGSDAHSPKDQGNAFDVVLGVLDELAINELVFPIAGSLRRVALRAVREAPQPAPAEPAAAAPLAANARATAAAEERVPETVAGDDRAAVAEPAKPVRKARPAAKPTRTPETSPERSAERATNLPVPEAAPVPPPEPAPEPPPPTVVSEAAAEQPALPAAPVEPALAPAPDERALPEHAGSARERSKGRAQRPTQRAEGAEPQAEAAPDEAPAALDDASQAALPLSPAETAAPQADTPARTRERRPSRERVTPKAPAASPASETAAKRTASSMPMAPGAKAAGAPAARPQAKSAASGSGAKAATRAAAGKAPAGKAAAGKSAAGKSAGGKTAAGKPPSRTAGAKKTAAPAASAKKTASSASAKKAARKTVAARPAAKKAAAAKKTTAKKPAAKRAPARASATKKTATAKKTPAKAPARGATARKAGAKKSIPKKTATKRR